MSFETPKWEKDEIADAMCVDLFHGNFIKKTKKQFKNYINKEGKIKGQNNIKTQKSFGSKDSIDVQEGINSKKKMKKYKKYSNMNQVGQISPSYSEQAKSGTCAVEKDNSNSETNLKKKEKKHKNQSNQNQVGQRNPCHSEQSKSNFSEKDNSNNERNSKKKKKKHKKHSNLNQVDQRSPSPSEQAKSSSRDQELISEVENDNSNSETNPKKRKKKHEKHCNKTNKLLQRMPDYSEITGLESEVSQLESPSKHNNKFEENKKKLIEKTFTGENEGSTVNDALQGMEVDSVRKSEQIRHHSHNSTPSEQMLKRSERKRQMNFNGKVVEKKMNSSANKIKGSGNRDASSKETSRKFGVKLQKILDNQNEQTYSGDCKKNKRDLSIRERSLEKMKAARFRYLNEQIYSSEGKDMEKIFKKDPRSFWAYHEGYRQQVSRWPVNPIDVIIKSISKMPTNLVIADLGCGDATLAQSVSHVVHSFDLVAVNKFVTACDMAHVPLENESIDIVVFCLSLMGTNLHDYLKEANRVLKVGGLLKIAEVRSRFNNDVENFTKAVKQFGFKNTRKDESRPLFCFLDFKKTVSLKNKKKLPTVSLNPCKYKKR